MKAIVIAALAVGGAVLASSPIASAEPAQVEGNYATLEACEADGAGGQFTGPGADGTSFYCSQGDDGLYYLFITN